MQALLLHTGEEAVNAANMYNSAITMDTHSVDCLATQEGKSSSSSTASE
ncbi:hypothetical protein HMPREF0908_0453 [Selenomonas flueggei ATCC 43531]|uniref:Uncharacterized protein n=1 Tax=Selenomonas flueggei ATCC 43531 TaxID=638302 RepID=C4V206_9FIRM|nr:hypothetical protein HMPREF0908_0453 [Selenomonas flueggei ATCC 43531]